MGVTGVNHAVLYVRDAARTGAFYRDVLDFVPVIEDPQNRYLFMRAPSSENHHDVAFFSVGNAAGASSAGRTTVGMYHIAWEVSSLDELARAHDRLVKAGALVGASDHAVNKSLYAVDPDGLEFEVMWLVPPRLWGDEEHEAIIRPLDIDAEQRRFAGLLTE